MNMVDKKSDLPPYSKSAGKDRAAEEESSAQESIAKPQSSLRKRIILVLGALVFLGGGVGAAAYYDLLPIPGVSKPAIAQKEPPATVLSAEAGPMVKISSLVINLKEESGRHYIKTTIFLEIGKKEWSEEINTHIPLIKDLIILKLSDKKLEDMKTPGAKENLKKELLAEINGALKAPKIKHIYFDEFLYN